jgi:hypothetical protein
MALPVPLGKLHTERLVPVDENVRQVVNRILVLRAQAPASSLSTPPACWCRAPEVLRLAGSADRLNPHRETSRLLPSCEPALAPTHLRQ